MSDSAASSGGSTDRMTFSEAPRKVRGFIAANIVLLAVSVFLCYAAADVNTVANVALAALATATAVGLMVMNLNRWLRKSPRLVLDSRGFLDRDGLNVVIPWADIATLARTQAQGHEILDVRLRDPDALLKQVSLWRRARAMMDMRLGSPAAYVESTPWARQDFDRIVSFSLLYHSRYGAP